MRKISTLSARTRCLCARTMFAVLLLSLGLVAGPALARGSPEILWSEAGHSADITAVAISPDGSSMATSSRDGTLKLWRYPDLALLHTLVLPYAVRKFVTGFSMVRFTPDGAHVVAAVNLYDGITARDSGAVQLFRVSDGRRLAAFGHQDEGIASLDISPDGLWVATAGLQRGVTIWRLVDGALVQALKAYPGGASDVHFSPTGDRLAAAYSDHHLALYRTSDWGLAWETEAHAETISRSVFSPDGSLIGTASLDGKAKLFEAASGALVHSLGGGSGLYALAFSPDGTALSVGGLDGAIRLWDVAGGKLIRTFADSGGYISSLSYASDGQVLISGGTFASRLKAWNPADGTLLRTLTRLASSVNKVVVSADSKWVAIAASFDRAVHVFHAASGRRLYSWRIDTNIDIEDVAFSPDNRLIAMPGPDNSVLVRRLSDGKTVQKLVGHQENVVGLGFSHDGKLLATGSFFPGAIRLWRTADWSLVREIKGGQELGAFGPFVSLTFSPDDQSLGTIAEGAPLVLRIADGSVVARPDGISRSARFSPDGLSFVISGGVYLNEVRIFRVSDWTLLATLPTGANDLAFSADGLSLLVAHLDALRIWRTSDWTVARTYDRELGYSGSGGGVQAVAIAPNGSRYAYGRDDATLVVARLWARHRQASFSPVRPAPRAGSAL